MRLGLLARTVVALVLVGLVPLAVVPYLIRLNDEALSDQVLRAHALAARTTAAQVSALVASVRTGAAAAALNPGLVSDPGSAASQGVLSGLLQAQPTFAAASLRNADGQELVRVQARGQGPLVERLLAEPLAGDLALRHEEGRPWLRVAAPTPGGTGSLEVVADLAAIDGVLRPDELGRDAVLALATRDGRLLAASGAEATLETFPPALVAAGRSGQVSGAVSSAQAGVIGAYAPVSGAPWFVVSRQPSSVAEAVGRGMRRRALLAVAAALVLTAAVSAGAWRSVVRPLRDLVAAQRRLARAELPTPRGDEIGALRDAVSLLERQTSDREAIGQRFLGRYQVLDVLGSGGMGSVFRGWDPKLRRQVALKTVRHASTSGGTSSEQLRKLVDEAVTVAGLGHPNVVAVYDVEDSPEAAFISMELVEGTSLERYLGRVRKLRLEEAPPLVAQVARGLAAAHGRGIAHRDVKPGNVLLGRDGAVKLTDFGVAGEVAAPASGAVLGTPGFIPPEALRGEPQDARGDLFACGVLLYQALGGCLPFAGRSPSDTLLATLRDEAVPLRQHLVSVPQDLDALVRGLLEKNPGRRWPQSAAELADRLEGMCAERGWRWTGPSVVDGEGGRTGDTGAVGTVPEVGQPGRERGEGAGASRGRA